MMGQDYFKYMQKDRRELFLQGILDKQKEKNRLLFLMRHRGKYLGFVHMKLDIDNDHLCSGFITEFYVIPRARRRDWERWMYQLCEGILVERGITNIYVSTDTDLGFWQRLGFRDTENIDYNNMKIMDKTLES
jgi:ribosomal protein S18 acetylase RimI-like enzyme